MDVHVDEYVALVLCDQPIAPPLDVARPVDLDPRIIPDPLIRAHQSDVSETRGRPRRQLQHLLALDPASVGERECDVVFGEKREDAVVNPATLPELDREANVAWKLRQ